MLPNLSPSLNLPYICIYMYMYTKYRVFTITIYLPDLTRGTKVFSEDWRDMTCVCVCVGSVQIINIHVGSGLPM